MNKSASSLPEALLQRTLNRVIQAFGLTEVPGENDGPWLPLVCQAPLYEGGIGQVRLYRGGPLFQVVTSTIVVPPIQLDSHMMFAFTPSDSAVPTSPWIPSGPAIITPSTWT